MRDADGLVVPGVGAFRAVMDALRASRGDELIDRRLAGGAARCSVSCVGMQVLFERGVERGVDTDGLGEWPGAVTELDAPVLPHMGWNTVTPGEGSRLFQGIEDERFYFVHSYGAQQWTLDVQPPFPPPALTWCTYGSPFLAAVENGPLSATQFHPEKSRNRRHPSPGQLDRRARRGYALTSCVPRTRVPPRAASRPRCVRP